jgi:hypothetical protein
MYLKSALICEGMTVFNPVILKSLNPGYELTRSNCAWGHCLVDLATRLSEKRSDFDLQGEMNIRECRVLPMPMTIEAGFALFDPFFSELRYPQELKKLGGCGPRREVCSRRTHSSTATLLQQRRLSIGIQITLGPRRFGASLAARV